MEKPKVKFLTVVWGEAYIERFCSLSLPSFMAPGNLPSLAKNTELEVVIMTCETDRAYFEKNLSFLRLRDLCSVRFISIDDLMGSTVYGVTLTLAYARPIIACGEDMLNTHFLFMNADFVLADGSLRSLIHHIHTGRSIVLGPSYRAIAEEVEPTLGALVNKTSGVLEIAPRDLVRLSLPHPHRTTMAKTMNQQVFYSTHPNQLFWQVDENTVLGKYYLIFMLCLKPERVMHEVKSYCDYSFIPELCPSGDEVAMGDSDDFFMLEMQSRTQETSMLRQGTLTYRNIAQSLNQWATAEHRRFASHDIVFHSAELPAELVKVKREAGAVVESINRFFKTPKTYLNHYYWVMGVEAWKGHRRVQGLSCEPLELAPYILSPRVRLYLYKHRSKNFFKYYVKQLRIVIECVGRFIFLPGNYSSILSSSWQMAQICRTLGLEQSDKKELSLIIGPLEVCRASDENSSSSHLIQLSELKATLKSSFRYEEIFFLLPDLPTYRLGRILRLLPTLLTSNGTIHIIGDIQASRGNYLKAVDLVFQLGELLGSRIKLFSICTSGGVLLMVGDRLQKFAIRHFLKFGRVGRLMMTPLLVFVAILGKLLTFFANAFTFKFGQNLTSMTHGAVISIQLNNGKSSADEVF
ncbi:hypothetical protein [Polynucleobacter paneuropaeus]|uniref:hypothetical protein n=1 Tax=Polynucleobacter paneuropaeus TaxID=2527775 RepID=UPI001BFCDE6A|nr:hypothetical protein [Polynucleobacter paneuropaeus]MBT8621915.1 hypothetical protein [Polynucleobacter paneuropaeus]